jgi:hypothetical protein
MATATLKCRVCGKEYEACRNAKRIDGVFRWQDVACSAEHGAIYLDLIRKSRAKKHDAVANDLVSQAFRLFDEEYLDDIEDDMFDDESEDAEDPEIEV